MAREEQLQLSGIWLALTKMFLTFVIPFCLALLGWGTWVTVSINSLKTEGAVTTSLEGGRTLRNAGVDEKLNTIQKDITEIKVLISSHIAALEKKP